MKKTVLITGTSSGMGRASANVFAAHGWNVIATMRHPDKEKDWHQRDNMLVTRLDIEKADTIESAIELGIKKFDKIDVLINNAGQGLFGVFEATPTESISRLFKVNVFGTMKVIRAMLPHFRERQEGMIVNVSSSTGLFTLPLMSAYCASKYALEGFSESLSFELASQHIKIKLIEPGMVDTHFDDATRDNYSANENQAAYNSYFEKMIKLFAKEETAKVTAEVAASIIYKAVTDGTDTLRYVIGDDVKAMVALRNSLPGQEYIDMMRKQFSV